MKINEILLEQTNCTPGWQKTDTYPERKRGGEISINIRLDENCEIDAFSFVYKNARINDYDDENDHTIAHDNIVVAVAKYNNKTVEYDYKDYPMGKNLNDNPSASVAYGHFIKLINKHI